jgi:hypothetical protein
MHARNSASMYYVRAARWTGFKVVGQFQTVLKGHEFTRAVRAYGKKAPKIENARDRSLWRFNLDHSQYNRCCVLQLPQWPPSSFRWRCYLWLRRHSSSDFRRRPALRLDRWPTFRLGSVSCPSARPAANLRLASTVPRFRSTFGDPSSLRLTILVPSGLRRMALPPARPTTYLRFASMPSFGSAGGFIRLAPHAAPAPRLARPPVCTGCFTLRLHRP